RRRSGPRPAAANGSPAQRLHWPAAGQARAHETHCMIAVTCCLWDPNGKEYESSRCFDEKWVERLYRGFKRNLTIPFRFICYTDRIRTYGEPIEQVLFDRMPPDYGSAVEVFRTELPFIF